MTDSEAILRIEGLSKRFGHRDVLKDIHLTMQRGRVGVLIGPSGAGKSTLLRCVNGLESFDAGRLVIASEMRLDAALTERERYRSLLAIRRRVGMVFQDFNLFPHMSVLGNIIEAPMRVLGRSREESIAEARRMLDRVGLLDRCQSMPDELSGGQQQRVAIARTLAMQPDLILFDEPTSALDPRMTQEVLSVMGDLARGGQSMLVVTHAMEFARRVAQDVHVLFHGEIFESGSPEHIFGPNARPETRQFLNQEMLV